MIPRAPKGSFGLSTITRRAIATSQCLRTPHRVSPVLATLNYHQHHSRPQPSLLSQSRRPNHEHTFLRHASSSTAAAIAPAKPTPSAPPVPLYSTSRGGKGKLASTSPRTQSNSQTHSALNPPEETYAPELSVPSRAPGQNYFGYLFRCGKAYIGFYKTGIKRVRATAKLAKTLRQRQNASVLTRAEWQIVRRSRKDLIRLLPFGVMVLVLGEWMPLIAAWITPVVPEACRIPMQVDKALRKKEERRRERLRRAGMDAARLIQRDQKPGQGLQAGFEGRTQAGLVRVQDLENMGTWDLVNLSARLDAHSRVWDWMFVYPPKGILRWGVRRKLEYLERDDALIARDGEWRRLSKVEVMRACEERGIDVLGRSEKDMERELGIWFKEREYVGGGKRGR